MFEGAEVAGLPPPGPLPRMDCCGPGRGCLLPQCPPPPRTAPRRAPHWGASGRCTYRDPDLGVGGGRGGRMAGGALLGVPRAYAAPSPFTLPQPHAAPYRAKPTPRLAPWGSRRMRVDTTCPKGFSSASSSCSSTPSGRLEM